MESVVTVNKKEKCPYCNKTMDVRNYKPGINNLELSRSEKTINAMKDVVALINEAMPGTVNEAQYYMLLKETSDIIGIVVRRTLQNFKEKKHVERGHGVHYLISMIKGENSSHALREEYERKTLDRLPPVKERDD
jgi:hypothetical protein